MDLSDCLHVIDVKPKADLTVYERRWSPKRGRKRDRSAPFAAVIRLATNNRIQAILTGPDVEGLIRRCRQWAKKHGAEEVIEVL